VREDAWAEGEERDLAEEMMQLTLAIVGRTLFDADVTGDARVVAEALTEAMKYLITLRPKDGVTVSVIRRPCATPAA
jgi:hypothetical protein